MLAADPERSGGDQEQWGGGDPPPPGKRQGGRATPFLQVLPHSYTKSGQMIALKTQMIAPGKPENCITDAQIRPKTL